MMPFERDHGHILRQRLDESPTFMIVIAGPRQIGKSTLVRQVLAGRPANFVAVDQPLPEHIDSFARSQPEAELSTQFIPGAQPTAEWLVSHWTRARAKARALSNGEKFVLAIDEIQKIPRWSEVVKGLWDSDRAEQV